MSFSSGSDSPRPPPHPFDEMWYVLVDNRAVGPRSGHDVKAMIERGEIGPQTRLAKVGAQQWTLIGDVPAFAPLLARSSVAPGRAAGPAPYAHTLDGAHFAGFWIRTGAYLIDSILQYVIIIVVSLIIGVIVGLSVGPGSGQAKAAAQALAILAELVIVLAYQAIFVSGAWQATPGKRLCGIHIIRVDGRKIGVGLALGRYLAMLVSAVTFYIGFMMAGWTHQKKALHDMICDTRVIYGRAEDDVPLATVFD